jgi:hypothetical protein
VSDTDSTLSLLIDIRSQLGGLNDAQAGISKLKEGMQFALGFSSIEGAAELLKATLEETVGAAFNLAAQTKEISDNLTIDPQSLQVLQLLAERSGASIEKLNMGLTELKRNSQLAQTDPNGGQAKAFAGLGLDPSQLSGLPLEDQFETVAKAISGSADQAKAFNSALEIMGTRNAPALMGAMKQLATNGFGQLSAEMEESGLVMSRKTMENLRNAQLQIDELKRRLTVFAGDTVSAILHPFGGGSTGATTLPPINFADYTQEAAWARQDKKDVTGGEAQLKMLTDALATEEELAKQNPFQHLVDSTQLIMLSRIRETLHDIITSSASGLPEPFRDALNGAIKTDKEDGTGLPYSVSQLTPPGTDLKALFGTMTEDQLKLVQRLDEELAKLAKLDSVISVKRTGGVSAFQKSKTSFNQVNDPVHNEGYMTMGQGAQAGAMGYFTKLGSAGQQVAGSLEGSIGTVVDGIGKGIYGWIAGTESWRQSLESIAGSVLQNIIETMIKMAIQQAVIAAFTKAAAHPPVSVANPVDAAQTTESGVGALFNSIMSLGPIAGPLVLAAAIGGTIALISSLFGGHREKGGPVAAGTSYVVGERRAEVFTPAVDGHIWPSVGAHQAALMSSLGARPVSRFNPTASALGSAFAGRAGASKPHQQVFVDDMRMAMKHAASTPEFESQIIDITRRNRGAILSI